ncbi:MAG TPA: cytochrome c family protein [Candidatus Hydrogenedentes bacterium]|nr:cytochrome c family protein [Candidatus Hydrogenedentota bacterium]HRK34821.1 cytochrome c family protein [Candidatus Hydrogenedentota bacterium]
MCRKKTEVVVLAVAVMLAFPLGVQSAWAADASEYIGESQCKVCHNKKAEGEQWNKWKETKHFKALESLKSEQAIAIGKEKGLAKPPVESPECLKCHVTAYDAATGTAPAKIKFEMGIQCETCHGPGLQHQADGKKILFEKDLSVDPKLKIITHPEEKTCLQCHNEESPTWNPEKYTTKDGKKVGFDFEQATAKNAHPNPLKKKEE